MVTGFDVEVLYLALKRRYRVKEVPVLWYYAPGSKVSPIRDSLRLFQDVVRVRWNDLRGRYPLNAASLPKAACPDTVMLGIIRPRSHLLGWRAAARLLPAIRWGHGQVISYVLSTIPPRRSGWRETCWISLPIPLPSAG